MSSANSLSQVNSGDVAKALPSMYVSLPDGPTPPDFCGSSGAQRAVAAVWPLCTRSSQAMVRVSLGRKKPYPGFDVLWKEKKKAASLGLPFNLFRIETVVAFGFFLPVRPGMGNTFRVTETTPVENQYERESDLYRGDECDESYMTTRGVGETEFLWTALCCEPTAAVATLAEVYPELEIVTVALVGPKDHQLENGIFHRDCIEVFNQNAWIYEHGDYGSKSVVSGQ